MTSKILITIILFLSAVTSFSQSQYEVSRDPNDPKVKVLKGIINKDLIRNDTSFKWYAESQKIYQHPDEQIIQSLKKNKDAVSYIIFGGTWCEDTQFILPKFFVLQEKAGIPDNRVTLFGVNREKQTLGNIATALNITNVPTIIVMKNGKEIGRVVEYGKTGHWDQELAEIVNSSF